MCMLTEKFVYLPCLKDVFISNRKGLYTYKIQNHGSRFCSMLSRLGHLFTSDKIPDELFY